MIEVGRPAPLGATPDGDGTNFAIFSSVAQRIELCLFDAGGNPVANYDLPGNTGQVWHGYLPGCSAGQQYGYRIHGVYDPDEGLRCNPNKLLIDPYARALAGEFTWHDAVFDRNDLDSARYLPKGVVCDVIDTLPGARPRIPWPDMIFYEANVRGFTMRHPAVAEADRGKFQGMRNAGVIEYLKALGVTSIELMPVHAFIDEHHLVKRGLRNFWGYNSISFFAPSPRYAQADAVAEFRDMVRAIHDAGIEVVLDVVYNHTGEANADGPTLSFRGIDNLAYYRTEPGDHGVYVNDTGTGNTVNVDHPRVQQLIMDSLRYWHREMGVDGFRFDLATILGRTPRGYSPVHPLSKQSAMTRRCMMLSWSPNPGTPVRVGTSWAAFRHAGRNGTTVTAMMCAVSGVAMPALPAISLNAYTARPTCSSAMRARRSPASTSSRATTVLQWRTSSATSTATTRPTARATRTATRTTTAVTMASKARPTTRISPPCAASNG